MVAVMKPMWKILVVRAGQPETLLEASRSWNWELRLAARGAFSLAYHTMLGDLMKTGKTRRVYSHKLAGASVRAHAWRTGNNVCFYVSSVTFDKERPAPDSCFGLDELAYEVFDQTSVSIITCIGKTWIFEQIQGDPILSPSLFAGDDFEGNIGGFSEGTATSYHYDEDFLPLQQASTKQRSRSKILRG